MMGTNRFLFVAIWGFLTCILSKSGAGASGCADVPDVPFAQITYDPPDQTPHPEGTNATVTCEFMYRVEPASSATRSCLDGNWTGQAASCQHIPERCPKYASLAEHYGLDCQRRCRSPLSRWSICPEGKICHCDGVCGWSCLNTDQENFCPEVETNPEVSVTYDPPERPHGGRAILSCRDGFQYYSGDREPRCLGSGTWSGNQMVCIPEDICSPFPDVENATPYPTSKMFFLAGEVWSYYCNRGYTILGDRYLTCHNNFTWSQPQFTCSPVYCGPPGNIAHAYLDNQLFTFDNRVTYVCRPGYRHPPNSVGHKICQANRQWTDTNPTCEPVPCPRIQTIDHGTVSGQSYVYTSQIQFECDSGYRLDGSSTRECQADGTWSGDPVVCTEIRCTAPPSPEHGALLNQREVYRYNNVVYYTCDEGYSREGSQSNRCTENEEWAYSTPVCGLPCTIPEYPRNGLFPSISWWRAAQTVNHGSTLTVRCNHRYQRRVSTLRCESGTWSDNDDIQPLCAGEPCQMPWPRETSEYLTKRYEPPLSLEDQRPESIPHGTNVVYGCVRGYELQGVTEQLCSHGQYSPQSGSPSCHIVSCDEEFVADGKFQYTLQGRKVRRRNGVVSLIHGTERKVICSRGYRNESFESSYCDDGEWANTGLSTAHCVPEPCAAIPESNMDVTYSGPANVERMYPNGTEVTVNCESGFSIAYTEDKYICFASQWTPVIPKCVQSDNRALGSTPIHKVISRQGGSARHGFPWWAIDGYTSDHHGLHRCTTLKGKVDLWWKTKLNATYRIQTVRIYNTLYEEGKYKLEGAEVRVGMNDQHRMNALCGEPITRAQIDGSTRESHGINIPCGEEGLIGKYISVELLNSDGRKRWLNLCEVEAYGPLHAADPGSQWNCTVPAIENAQQVIHPYTVGTVVPKHEQIRYSCDPGYTMKDVEGRDAYIKCTANHEWSPGLPVCIGESCNVTSPDNGNLLGSRITQHNNNIGFSCNSGYEKAFTGTIRCRLGQPHPEPPQCRPASCAVTDLPGHMSSTNTVFAHTETLTVACDNGFTLNLNETSLPTCSHGQWTQEIRVLCQEVLCSPPGSTNYARITWTNVPLGQSIHGARIQYECDEGLDLVGDSERECDNGVWTGSTPECLVPVDYSQPQPCMFPQRVSYERYAIRGHLWGNRDDGVPHEGRVWISVSCDPGFDAQPSVQTECLNGTWTVAVPRCVREDGSCSKPAWINHVYQYVNGAETMELSQYPYEELPEGTRLVHRCYNPGSYALQGGDRIRICSRRIWSGVAPHCEPVQTQIRIQGAVLSQVRSNGDIVIYPRDRLYIDCLTSPYSQKWAVLESNRRMGYYVGSGTHTNRMQVYFHSRQQTEPRVYTCRTYRNDLSHSVRIELAAIHCDTPGTPANGQRQDYDEGWKHGRYPMTKVIHYTCDEHYELVGANRIVCILGSWTDVPPRCQRVNCDELSPPVDGLKFGDGTAIGAAVLFACNQGYRRTGAEMLECEEGGHWSHAAPTCREIPRATTPCDAIECEDWEKCVITGVSSALCRCISPQNCPQSGPVVCGTDGLNYTSYCHLRASSCLLQTDVEEATSDVCIYGLGTSQGQQYVSSTYDDEAQSSFSYSTNDDTDGTEAPPAEGTQAGDGNPATTEAAAAPTQTNRESMDFCQEGICPTRTAEESCGNASAAVVVAAPHRWNPLSGILEINIHQVASGAEDLWRQGIQEVVLGLNPPADRGCLCPSFLSTDVHIIAFSREMREDGSAELHGHDFVQVFTPDLLQEILQGCPDPAETPAPSQDDPSYSVASSPEEDGISSLLSSDDNEPMTTLADSSVASSS